MTIGRWYTRVLAVCLALFAPQLFAQSFNYGEALQKSLFFYEAQRSGEEARDLLLLTGLGDDAGDEGLVQHGRSPVDG